MNKRFILIISVVAVFILSAITIIALLTRNSSQAETEPNIIGGKLLITTDTGPVAANNIYTNSLINYPDNGVGFAQSRFYEMSYFPADDGFVITLLDQDVETAATVAEADFLRILSITEAEACQLKVTMAVPNNINPAYAGRVFGLSYCLGE